MGAWSEDDATGDPLRLLLAGDFSRFGGDFVARGAESWRTGDFICFAGDFEADLLTLTGDFVLGRGEIRLGGLATKTGDLDDRLSLLLELETELDEDDDDGDRFLLMERLGIELLWLVDFLSL